MKKPSKAVLLYVGVAALFLAALALIGAYVAKPMLQSVKDPEAFRAWVSERGALGCLAYVLMCAAQVVVAFIPGEPFEIAGGYAFGWLGGTLLCLAGATLGGALVFSFVKRFGMKAATFLSSRKSIRKMRFLRDAKKLKLLTFVLFLLPGTPKDLLTYCVALTPMRLWSFLWITTVARIPSIISSSIGGSALGGKKYWFAAAAFAVTILISAAGLYVYKRVSKKHERRYRAARVGYKPKNALRLKPLAQKAKG